MNSKTMEGLVGAGTSLQLMNTPMRVFKEASRRGDTATMERAMGYVGEFYDKAEEYKAEADKGMEEDVKEAREKAKSEREEAVRKRREEREKLEERIEENRNADTMEISEEGKLLLRASAEMDGAGSVGTKADVVKEPVTYTKQGETVSAKQGAGISVSA